MIIIKFEESQITVSGHAKYAKKGEDIVCSAVSTLIQFFAEIIKKEKKGIYVKKQGYLKIKIDQKDDYISKTYDYIIEAIKTISEEYPDNLKVEVN